MTREDIKKHFPEATDDQISALLDINSKDIGKHKTAAETASADLKKAKDTIEEMEKNAKNADELQKTIDGYKAAEEQRQKDQKDAQERSERLSRFEKAHGEAGKDRKWLNDFTRDGIFAQFEKALADDANKGKSDVQIYNSIINDEKGVKPGIFEAQAGASGGGMSGMGGNPVGADAWLQQRFKNNPFFEMG
jgi:DNA repair exonuclease SbcCD ATPase subunit